jgi:hypothetical protein
MSAVWDDSQTVLRCVAHGKRICTKCAKLQKPSDVLKARKDRQPESGRQTFSDVAVDGACPKCGGTQFTAKRSKKGKVGLGVVALPLIAFAPKSQVKCVTCGTTFKRG